MSAQDDETECFEFLQQFEDASAKERPQVLKRWCLSNPWLAERFRGLARDTIRDEQRKKK